MSTTSPGVSRAATSAASASVSGAPPVSTGRPLCPGHGLVTARARSGDDEDARGVVAAVDHGAAGLDVEPDERPRPGQVLLAVDDHGGGSLEDDEDLLLVAADLVVLGNVLPGRDLDDVQPEGPDPERLAREPPIARLLEGAELEDGVAIGHQA